MKRYNSSRRFQVAGCRFHLPFAPSLIGRAGVGLFFLLLTSCGQPSVPTDYKQSDQLPKIYPDYVNVTVPVNIAPLTFMLDNPTTDMIARYKAGDEEVVYADKMQPTEEEWQRLKDKARGYSHGRMTSGHASSLSTSMCRPTPSTPISVTD